MMSTQKQLCVGLNDVADVIGCLRPAPIHGAWGDCTGCDDEVWNAWRRSHMLSTLYKAQLEINALKHLWVGTTARRERIMRHKMNDCRYRLCVPPIQSLGKRVDKRVEKVTVCYRLRSGCDASTNDCGENDWIAQVVVDDLPPEYVSGEWGADFRFCGSDCGRYFTNLEEPCFDLPLCSSPTQPTGCIPSEDCGVTTPAGEQGVDYLVATWPLYEVIRPDCDKATITVQDRKMTFDCFVDDLEVVFWCYDESLAVEHVETCSCGCPVCMSQGVVTATVVDAERGEICLNIEGCSCERSFYVNYVSGTPCGETNPLIKMVVVLRALILGGKRLLRCGCDKLDKMIEYWLDQSEESIGLVMRKPSDFPYGTSNAGVRIAEIIDSLTSALAEGKRLRASGVVTTPRRHGHQGLGRVIL